MQSSRKTASQRSRQGSGRRGEQYDGFGLADLALVLLLASPVAIVPGGLNRFVFGKLLLAALGAALAFSARPSGRLARSARILLALGVGVLLAAALAAQTPLAALAGRAERYEGAFTLTTYALAGIAGARLFGPSPSGRTVRTAARTMAVVAIGVGFVALLEACGLRPLSTNLARPGGLLGNASDEGALAALYTLPLAVLTLRTKSRLTALGTIAAAMTTVLSASRGALIGLVVGLMIAAATGTRRTRWTVLGGAAGVGALAMLVPFTRDRVLDASPLAQHTVSGRAQLWQETLSLVVSRPILGVGPSGFQVAIVAEHDRQWQSTVGPANPPESPHNWILQTLSAGGLLLLAVLVGLLVILVHSVLPRLREREPWCVAASGGLVAYGTALLFHLTSPGTTIPAAVLAGSLLATAPQPERRWFPRATAALAGGLALVFLLGCVAEIMLRRATLDVARGDLPAADRAFSVARTLRPWDVDLPATALHEFAVVAQDGSSQAIRYGTQWAGRTGPVSADEQVIEDRATLFESAGRFAAAYRLINDQLRVDWDNPLLLLRRGVLHAELRQWVDGERDLRSAAAISPESPEPWRDLATLYGELGKAHDAAAARAKARRLGG